GAAIGERHARIGEPPSSCPCSGTARPVAALISLRAIAQRGAREAALGAVAQRVSARAIGGALARLMDRRRRAAKAGLRVQHQARAAALVLTLGRRLRARVNRAPGGVAIRELRRAIDVLGAAQPADPRVLPGRDADRVGLEGLTLAVELA